MNEELRDEMKKMIKGWGFELGTLNWGVPVPHTIGLPSITRVLVRPEWARYDGARTIVVTPTEVIDFEIEAPYACNRWQEVYRAEYDSLEKSEAILKILAEESKGVWEKI